MRRHIDEHFVCACVRACARARVCVIITAH